MNWTPTLITRLKELAASGVDYKKTALILTRETRMVFTYHMVASYAKNNDIQFAVRPCNKKAKAWQPEVIEALRGLMPHKTGKEAAEILNAQFGTMFTRNSVISKCQKEKIAMTDHSLGLRQREMVKRVAKKIIKPVLKPLQKLKPVKKPEPLPVEPQTIEPLGIDISEIQNGQCRFPLWDKTERTDFKFCGLACEDNYCAAHRAIMFTAPRRSLERIAAISHN